MEPARRKRNRRSRLLWLSPRTGRSQQNLVQTTSTQSTSVCVRFYFMCIKKLSFILHPASRRNSEWQIHRASSSGNHRGWFADVLLYKPSSPLTCCFVTPTFFHVIVCEQTVYSRNNIQRYRQRPRGGVDSGGMRGYPARAFLHSTIFKPCCLFTL